MRNLVLLSLHLFFFLLMIYSCKTDAHAGESIAETESSSPEDNPNIERDAYGTIEYLDNPARQGNVQNAEPTGPTTTIKFKEERFDYGTVKEGSVVEHDFEFLNAGDIPLILQNVTASCGCTTPSWPREPIMPGKTGIISAKFDTRGRGSESGSHQSKSITVRGNFTGGLATLTLRGVVVK
jgi:hypothetical protein